MPNLRWFWNPENTYEKEKVSQSALHYGALFLFEGGII